MVRVAVTMLLVATSSVAHAQRSDELGAPETREPTPATRPPPAERMVNPYIGFGLGGYGHVETQHASPMVGASLLGGLEISPWFRVELRIDAGVRPLYYPETPGSYRADLVPFARIAAPFMGGLFVSDVWSLYLGSYPSVGLTSEWNWPGAVGMPFNIQPNESVGFGNFFLLVARVESNVELSLRADGEVVFSLGWGTHVLATLTTAVAIR